MDLSKQARSQELSMRRRAMGLMKKTDELSTLCGVDACLIISGVKVGGRPVKPFFWPPSTEKIKSVFNRYKGYNMKAVARKAMKFSKKAMKTKALEGGKKVMKTKASEGRKRAIEKKTSGGSKKEMEKKTTSEGKQIIELQNLSVAQLQDFVKNCDAGLEALRRRMDEVRQEKMQVDKL